MGRQSRKYNPRTRNKRPIGLTSDNDQSPNTPHPLPTELDAGWFLPNPLGARLNQKSGLGVNVNDGIKLEPIEILFCHWNRHIPIADGWINQMLENDGDFIAKSVVFDVARSGGEIVIPVGNLVNNNYTPNTFAVKWSRNVSHSKTAPISQIRWFWASQTVDWAELTLWVNEVLDSACIPEVFVIDDEMDITMYRLGYDTLSGSQMQWNDLDETQIESIKQLIANKIETPSGCFIDGVSNWPLSSIGVEHLSGINLRHEEANWIMDKLNSNDSNDSLYAYLADSGCVMRPGFKYGCKWRVYDDEVGKSHAPWLLQPLTEAPKSWEQICLSVRLAEGVHKKWVCGMPLDNEWKFMNIKRWLPGRV